MSLLLSQDCEQPLIDTIINFGDNLEEDIIAAAEDEAAKADLVICLGTTISVTPASYIVEDCCRRKTCRVVICNRQRTDLDAEATLRIFGDCDPLCVELLKKAIGAEQFELWMTEREERLQSYGAIRNAMK